MLFPIQLIAGRVALYALSFIVLAIFELRTRTRQGKIFFAAVKGRYAVIVTGDNPPVFIQCGLYGKLIK